MIRSGLRAARTNYGAVIWTYLASLLSAFPLGLAAATFVHGTYGHSLEAVAFARRPDTELLVEFLTTRGHALLLYIPLIVGAMLFWGALSAFLSGAVLVAVSGDEPTPTAEFFSGGGRVFGRLLRLMLFGLPFTVLIVGLAGAGVFALRDWLVSDWVSEKGVVALKLTSLLVTGLVLAWVNATYDLMKAESVAQGEHRARYAFVRGIRRAVMHPLEVLAIYLPFVFASLALTVVVSLIDARIDRASWLLVLAGLALQQLTALARAALSVGLAGAEVAYVRGGR